MTAKSAAIESRVVNPSGAINTADRGELDGHPPALPGAHRRGACASFGNTSSPQARAPVAYTRSARSPSSGARARNTVASMQPDATYKHLRAHAFMVEALLRWLVADLRGMREPVDALERSTLARCTSSRCAPAPPGTPGNPGAAGKRGRVATTRGEHPHAP